MKPYKPQSYAEVLTHYGNIKAFIGNDGTVLPSWELKHIVRIPLPARLAYDGSTVSRVAVHTKLAVHASETFRAIHSRGFWHLLVEYSGGFEVRSIRGKPKRMSLHAHGMAFDFDAVHNGLGTVGDIDLRIVQVFREFGWTWGGDFKGRKDPMHFQWADNC